jgi:SNF2 family DNA or RNA helicase
MWGTILANAEELEKFHAEGERNREYYPTLMIIPSTLVNQYLDEWAKSFKESLDLVLWYGTDQDERAKNLGAYVGKRVKDVEDWYGLYEDTNPKNARRIFLTTYSTLRARAGRKVPENTENTDREYLLSGLV